MLTSLACADIYVRSPYVIHGPAAGSHVSSRHGAPAFCSFMAADTHYALDVLLSSYFVGVCVSCADLSIVLHASMCAAPSTSDATVR